MHELDDITGAIIDAAVKVHRELEPGLLESVYEVVLAHEVASRGFQVARQRAVRIEYDGLVFQEGFRADLVVEGRAVVEIKSVERLAPVHYKQVLTYLRLMHLEGGLLINFANARSKRACIASSTASPPPHLRASA
jgi:GxxExxY protein